MQLSSSDIIVIILIVTLLPYLSDVVLVQAPLQPHPGLGLEVGDLFDHLEDVGHLLDGDHLLVPQAHPQVADALDGRLDVRLLVRLHVDVALDVVGGHHGLDLQRLRGDTSTAGSHHCRGRTGSVPRVH